MSNHSKLVLACLCLALVGCGKRLEGVYGPKDGPATNMIEIEFKDSKTAIVNVMGMRSETGYEVDGDDVKINIQGQNMLFRLDSDDCFSTAWGRMCKKTG